MAGLESEPAIFLGEANVGYGRYVACCLWHETDSIIREEGVKAYGCGASAVIVSSSARFCGNVPEFWPPRITLFRTSSIKASQGGEDWKFIGDLRHTGVRWESRISMQFNNERQILGKLIT